MNTKDVVLVLMLLILGMGCQKAPCEGSNILFVVVDTLRADHLTPYGYRSGVTPEIKKFAEQGVLFEKAVANASFTMASMGSILTSTYPHHHGATRHPSILGPENLTLQEVLKEEGYITGGFVCNPLLHQDSGFGQGFDTYVNVGEMETNGAQGLVEKTLDWIKENRKNKFYVWLHLLDPHFPYHERKGFEIRRSLPKAKEEYKLLLQKIRLKKIKPREVFFDCPLSLDGVNEAIKSYDSEIAWIDYYFGKLLAGLIQLGLDKNTVVVFLSDHGETLSNHGLHFSHGFSVHEEALWVPLIIRTPLSHLSGRRIRNPVQMLDLAPTLLSLCGIKIPETMEGGDLKDLIMERSAAQRYKSPPIFSECEPMYVDQNNLRRYPNRRNIHVEGDKGKWRSVQLDGYKLIRIPHKDEDKVMLFDIIKDPKETRNIAAKNPERTKTLLKLLMDWTNDPSAKESNATLELDEEWRQRLNDIGYTR